MGLLGGRACWVLSQWYSVFVALPLRQWYLLLSEWSLAHEPKRSQHQYLAQTKTQTPHKNAHAHTLYSPPHEHSHAIWKLTRITSRSLTFLLTLSANELAPFKVVARLPQDTSTPFSRMLNSNNIEHTQRTCASTLTTAHAPSKNVHTVHTSIHWNKTYGSASIRSKLISTCSLDFKDCSSSSFNDTSLFSVSLRSNSMSSNSVRFWISARLGRNDIFAGPALDLFTTAVSAMTTCATLLAKLVIIVHKATTRVADANELLVRKWTSCPQKKSYFLSKAWSPVRTLPLCICCVQLMKQRASEFLCWCCLNAQQSARVQLYKTACTKMDEFACLICAQRFTSEDAKVFLLNVTRTRYVCARVLCVRNVFLCFDYCLYRCLSCCAFL